MLNLKICIKYLKLLIINNNIFSLITLYKFKFSKKILTCLILF